MATHAHTTDADRTRSTRRAMLLGAAVLPGAAAAGSLASPLPPNPDAELMRAIDHFRSCHATILAIEACDDHSWSEVDSAGVAWNEAAEGLCIIPSFTVAGLAAKAAALAMVLHAGVGDYTHPERFEENAEPHDRLALALVQDVLRLTGGAA